MAFTRHPDSTSPDTDQAETRMRLSLGLGTANNPSSSTSVASDPLKGARQAIRSQAAAREYVERQLVHAEATIQELRTKLHHARREKDAAAETARFATAAKLTAERTVIVTEAAFNEEKAARDRADRALREARATIGHLQAKAEAAAPGLEAAKAELAAERQARQKAEDSLRVATATIERLVTVAVAEPAEPPSMPTAAASKRRAPRATEEAMQVVPTDRPDDTGNAVSSDTREEAAVPTIRRPAGRPQKTAAVSVPTSSEPIETTLTPNKGVGGKTEKLRATTRSAPKPEPQPVQWWVKGWDRRRAQFICGKRDS